MSNTQKTSIFILIIVVFGAILVGSTQRERLADFYYQTRHEQNLPEPKTFQEVTATENDPKQLLPVKTPPAAPLKQAPKEVAQESAPPSDVPKDLPDANPEDASAGEEMALGDDVSDLPKDVNLAVPFTPQAPHANWDLPYQETCEEASLYMTHEFYQGVPGGRIDPDTADAEILKLVEFQDSLFGTYEDTTALQTGLLAEAFYGYQHIELMEDPTVEDIKRHVAAGRPVLVPAAGQLLGNPFFSGIGPPYHMLVIRGYTQTAFITNDPGTRRGEGFLYSYDKLMNAIHDWTGTKDTIEQGRKVVLVIYPEE